MPGIDIVEWGGRDRISNLEEFVRTGLQSLGTGTSQTVFTTTSGQQIDISIGTTAAPDTGLNPGLKVSRRVSVTGSLAGVPDQISAIQAVIVGDGSNREQVQGITAEAVNSALASDTGSVTPDAVAVYGFGWTKGAGATGIGTGAYLEGRTEVATGKIVAAELRCNNQSGGGTSFASGSASTHQGLWLTVAGAKSGAAISIGGVNNIQWDAGIVITSVGSSGPVLTVSFADYSSSLTSIAINGTHTAAIAVAASAGYVVIGGTATMAGASSLFEVQNPAASAADPLVQFGRTDTLHTFTVAWRTSGALAKIGMAGATNSLLTGTAAGDLALYNTTASKSVHIGGTTSVIQVTNGNALGFFGVATPVAKQTVTGSKGANAALTSLMAALAAYGIVTDSTT